MFDWLRRRKVARHLVASDARALVERFGAQAYLEARLRQHEQRDVFDGNRPPGHWERVKNAIDHAQRAKSS